MVLEPSAQASGTLSFAFYVQIFLAAPSFCGLFYFSFLFFPMLIFFNVGLLLFEYFVFERFISEIVSGMDLCHYVGS